MKHEAKVYILISTYAELVQTSFYQQETLSVCTHRWVYSLKTAAATPVVGIKIHRKEHELELKTEK